MDDRFADEGKYKSSLDDFSTLFHEDRVYVGERAYSTGQCVVDILNVEEEELSAIDQALEDVYHAIQRVWKENTESSVRIAQEKCKRYGFLYPGCRSIGICISIGHSQSLRMPIW